jgi:molybdopterin synthase sulfur carrier subunit
MYGPLRDELGKQSVERSLPSDATIETLLRTLFTEVPEIERYDSAALPQFVDRKYITVNGRHIDHLDGIETVLEDGDRVWITEPVSGG